MRNTSCTMLVTLFALLFLCSVTSPAGNSTDFVVNVGNEQLRSFVAQPELGYVVKSSRNKSTLLSLNSTSQIIQSEDTEYLNVANRPDIRIVFSELSSVQNKRNIRTLSNQPDTEYVAPIYTLDGEIVAIIPEIIVRLVHESDLDKLEELCMEVDCIIIRNLLYTKQEFLISPTAQNAEQVLTAVEVFASADFVEWAWPNIAFQPKLCNQPIANEPNRLEPDDEFFDKQWHLDAIRAPEAWSYTTGDPNIVVAVLDNGFDINHPDLVNNIWVNHNEDPNNGIDDDENGLIDDVHGWDFVKDVNDVNPVSSIYAHGTACAGLIAAQGNNNLGITGVTWNCTIMPIRILPSPATKCPTLTEPVDGLRYAAAQGADIISNSWSMYLDCQPIHSAIKDITRSGGIGRNGKGCIVFFASGNREDGGFVKYPAIYPEVIAVGAIDQNDIVWYYSGQGTPLDMVAPSGDADMEENELLIGNLWTTDISGDRGYNNRDPNILNYTDRMGGTSGACPIVAGVAALILSIDPNLTNIEVQSIMLHSARDLGPLGWDEKYGFGCVDAYTAVNLTLQSPDLKLYVDANAPNDPGPNDPNIGDPNEDGSSEHPFDSIQKAIDYSVHGDIVIVLPGIYTGNGNRDIDFHGRMITVRSQDGPESCIIDCESKGRGFYFPIPIGGVKDIAYSVLEGFTITNGQAQYGGGMYIIGEESNPTIINCIFTKNSADQGGGGLHNSGGSPIITNCIFTENSANYGGGMHNIEGNPIFVNCKFTKNSANENGGGIFISKNNDKGQMILTGCILSENSAKKGGGLSNRGSSIITNCIFTGNAANSLGGGFQDDGTGKSTTITNCTFTGNSAKSGGGLYVKNSTYSVTNCIFWDNNPSEIYVPLGIPQIIYNNIQDGWPGEDNINVDPLFVNPGYWDPNETQDNTNDDFWVDGDYHLMSQTGRWDPISQSWIKDDVTSSCIDAGDPNSDWSSETWPHGGRINMGAYGGTRQASMSTETDGMSLPRVAYIFSYNDEAAEDFDSLLESYGCPTTLIKLDDVAATSLDSHDLITVAHETQYEDTWSDPNAIAAIEDFGKPVVGLGDGGYDFFGLLGLWIGNPNGGHGSNNSIEVVDPNSSLFSTPYSIDIPEDRALQLYTETNNIGIYLWPTIPETVTVLGKEVDAVNYFPLAMQHNRYLLWGFTESPQKMTEVGKTLFINVVIRTANKAWESNI